MTIAMTSPVAGATVAGLTSPTYSVAVDQAPNTNSKQWYVSAIGGTQTGVDAGSSATKPWTFTWSRPAQIKTLNAVDSNGVIRQVAFNTYEYLMRRGFIPLAGQAVRVANWRTQMPVLAGSDTADAQNIRAAVSSYIGGLNQQASGLAESMITGSL